VSVQITDVSGVAGLIQPNSKVDVLFTRPGSMAEATTSTILQNVKVLSTGRQTQTGQAVDPRAPKSPVVTLVLLPGDAQKLELAKNEGKISLSLRNPLDSTQSAETGPVTTEVLDPMISARMARARKGRTTNIARANLEDPRVWQDLTGEKKLTDPQKEAEEARRKREAERPRIVVDVYRGDKHVQELFK
jgi:pilus assembly protein CpaB